MTHLASGILIDSNMTEVHAIITDLNEFITSAPDADIVVCDNDGESFQCKKNEVTWVCVNEV
jgi:hypothetical protein